MASPNPEIVDRYRFRLEHTSPAFLKGSRGVYSGNLDTPVHHQHFAAYLKWTGFFPRRLTTARSIVDDRYLGGAQKLLPDDVHGTHDGFIILLLALVECGAEIRFLTRRGSRRGGRTDALTNLSLVASTAAVGRHHRPDLDDHVFIPDTGLGLETIQWLRRQGFTVTSFRVPHPVWDKTITLHAIPDDGAVLARLHDKAIPGPLLQ